MVLGTEYRVQGVERGGGEGRDGAGKVLCKICDKFFITLRLGVLLFQLWFCCFSYGLRYG